MIENKIKRERNPIKDVQKGKFLRERINTNFPDWHV